MRVAPAAAGPGVETRVCVIILRLGFEYEYIFSFFLITSTPIYVCRTDKRN